MRNLTLIRLALIGFAMTFFGLSSEAQIITVGNGSTTTTSMIESPYGTFYMDDRTQILYTASEIISAGGYAGFINSFWLNTSSTASYSMTNFTVSIGTTSNTNLSSGYVTNLTQVYTTSSFTTVVGWQEFPFDSPFNWNGSDNIVIDICFDNNAWSSPSGGVRCDFVSQSVYSLYQDLSSGTLCGTTNGFGGSGNYRAQCRFEILPPYADDAGIQQILSPTLPTCDLDSIDIVAVLINGGTDTLQNCSIHYQINSSSVVSTYYTGAVAPLGGTDTVTLGNVSFTNADDLVIWTTDPNGATDSLSTNDSSDITVQTGLSGTYSIPGDYATITAASDDLSTFGVCGDVVFNLSPGTYNEQVSFDEILGVSEDATVTFQSLAGNWNSAIWTYGSPGTVIMDGADWVTFKNLKIINTSANVVQLPGTSDNITIEHCWLKGVSVSSSGGYYSLIDMSGVCHNFSLLENKLEKGSNWFNSQSGSTSSYKENFVIEDNWMKDQSYGYGYIYYIDGMEFNRNRITNDSAFSSTYAYMAAGYWNYVNNFNVTRNYVGATAGNGWYYAMYMLNCVGSSNPRSQFANNCMITGNANLPTAYYSLYMSGCGLVDMFNNSFTHASNTSTYNVYIANGGAIELKNNNFINYASNAALYVNGAFAVTESDYNNFYSPGGQLIYYGSAFYNDLASHQTATGQDMNSVSTDPDWEDLMLCVTCNDTIGNAGTVLSTITDDINGNGRSVLNPDIGAVEYVTPGSFDLGPNDTLCGNEVIMEAGPAQSVTWSVSENGGTPQTYTTAGVTLAASGSIPTEFEVSVSITTLYCGSGTDDIEFRLIPDATLDSAMHLCADETVTLAPGGGTNATYAWSTGESTATIDVNSAGSFSVIKMEEGCESEATIAVSQSTAVEIGDVEGCETDAPITVDATIPDGSSYAWSGGNAPTAAANNFDASGVYTITATDNFGCVSEDEFELFVLGDPVADISYTGSGGTAIFFSSAGSQQVGPSTTYLWTFNSIDTSSQPNPIYSFPWNGQPTTYPVTLVIDNGCDTDLDDLNIVIDPLSVDEISNSSFQVYPNPAINNVIIQSSNDWKTLDVSIIDNTGRVVMTDSYNGTQMIELNVSELAAGVYSLQLSTEDRQEVQTLIIQ